MRDVIIAAINSYCLDGTNFLGCCGKKSGTRKNPSVKYNFGDRKAVLVGGGYPRFPKTGQMDILWVIAVADKSANRLCSDIADAAARKRGVTLTADMQGFDQAALTQLLDNPSLYRTIRSCIIVPTELRIQISIKYLRNLHSFK